MKTTLVLIISLALTACGGSSAEPDADPFAPDADPNAPDADPNAPDARPPGTPDAAPPPPLATCLAACSAASECAQASPLFDVDNYDCDDGTCRWTGCNSTGECTEAYANPNYTCREIAPLTFASCYPTCSTAADCAITGGGVLYDADNYACESGACRWTGCNSTGECQAGIGANYTCYQKGCWPTCSTASDCIIGTSTLYDADNYACSSGRCEWQGCNSTSECTDAFMMTGYVCYEG